MNTFTCTIVSVAITTMVSIIINIIVFFIYALKHDVHLRLCTAHIQRKVSKKKDAYKIHHIANEAPLYPSTLHDCFLTIAKACILF